ncbi:hypothetical protein [Niallia sp. BSM11]|uniref:hypothetical protein n=1 Tax=Niallia sp. BSM11 TaxID=3391576 RepID=UPI0039853C70
MKTKTKSAKHRDSLYGLDSYNFRYNGNYAALIKLKKLIDDDVFIFDITINDNVILENNNLRELNCTDTEKMTLIGMHTTKPFNNKEEVLRLASNCARKILEEYSDISIKRG